MSSNSYNAKCLMFESALKKIELEDFVIHDKVDDFIKLRENASRQENASKLAGTKRTDRPAGQTLRVRPDTDHFRTS